MTTRRFRKRRRPIRRRRRRLASHTPGHFVNGRTGGFMGLEMKFADIETSADAFSTTWTTMEDATNDSVSGVAQGDGESSRDGRKYAIHSIHIKAHIEKGKNESQAAPLDDNVGRFCLVLDRQTNGAQLTATDVMDGGQTDDVLAFRNLQHTKRFGVIWDKSWKLSVASGNTNEGAVNLFANGNVSTPIMFFNKKFSPPIIVTCTGTDGTISGISDNSLHIIGVATDVTAILNMQIN